MAPWPTGARVASSRLARPIRRGRLARKGDISSATNNALSSRCQRQTWPKNVLPSTSRRVDGSNAASQEPAMLTVISSNQLTPVTNAVTASQQVVFVSR